MPFGIQPWHIVVIVIAALIIFGPSKLPELGRSLGKTLNEFRTGAKEMTESLKEEINKGASPSQNNSPNVAANQGPAPFERPLDPSGAGTFCTQCGTQNPIDARFCKNCGNPISG